MADQEADTTVHDEQPTDEQPTDEQSKVEEERGEQTVTIEDVGPARKCVTIEIPHERIEGELKKNFDDLRSDAQLPGFRKGKAPDRLIEKRFGKSIRDDVRSRLIAESYSQALEEQELEVVGEPDVKDFEDIKLPDDGPMTFKVEIEVVPQIELPPLEGVALNRATVEVTDEDVATQIKEYQSRFGKLEDLAEADDAAAEGDYVVSDFRILAGEDADEDADEDLIHRAEPLCVLDQLPQAALRVHVLGDRDVRPHHRHRDDDPVRDPRHRHRQHRQSHRFKRRGAEIARAIGLGRQTYPSKPR